MLKKKTSWLTPLVAGLAACSGGDPVDIGDDKIVRTGEKLSDYAATWEGHAEAFEFHGQTDRLRIALDETGNGTFEVGTADPLPPPSDPEVGYPYADAPGPAPGGLYSGFAYTVRGATVENRRLRLGMMAWEVHKEWCELQTPILDEINSTAEQEYFNCLPNWFVDRREGTCSLWNPDTEIREPIDCGKELLCGAGGVCYCTAEGCTVYEGDDRNVTVTLDAALESGGNELEGTLVLENALSNETNRVIVRMTRH